LRRRRDAFNRFYDVARFRRAVAVNERFENTVFDRAFDFRAAKIF